MPIAGKSNILKNMEFLITRTAAGLSRYPLHRHDVFEIVCYLGSLDGELQKNGVARSLYGACLQLVMSLVRKREDGMISSLHNDLMNNLWNARFDLSEEIKEIGYTEDYVRRLFRDRYGKTPLQFLLSERIEYAKKLLDIYGRQMSIKEIAEMCGFSDPLYFSRMFKRAEGISPAAFIEKGGK